MVTRIGYALLICSFLVGCRSFKQDVWTEILDADNPLLAEVLSNPEKYELQIIYTEVNSNKEGLKLERHSFMLDTNTYFYPASAVKMPVAFLALEKLKTLRNQYPDINIHTPIYFDSIRPPQSKMEFDSCSFENRPSIASLIDQVFAISDNNAYNRLFEFTGQNFINTKLYEKKIFTNSRILTRVGVGGFDSLENTYCNPYYFLNDDGSHQLEFSGRQSVFNSYSPIPCSQKGIGYLDDDKGEVVMQSFDMTQKNFINLADLDRVLKRLILPQEFIAAERFDISDSDYEYLISSMEKLPRDIFCYADNGDHYYDGYVKFFMYGDTREKIPEHIKIKNKVGLAYGYLTDVAHIQDTKNNIEFFLSATLLVNDNQIFNDGNYEYDSIGIPFLAELGRQVYTYELSKSKQIKK